MEIEIHLQLSWKRHWQRVARQPEKSPIRSVVTCGKCCLWHSALPFPLVGPIIYINCWEEAVSIMGWQCSWPKVMGQVGGRGRHLRVQLVHLPGEQLGLNRSDSSVALPFFWQPAQLSALSPKRLSLTRVPLPTSSPSVVGRHVLIVAHFSDWPDC